MSDTDAADHEKSRSVVREFHKKIVALPSIHQQWQNVNGKIINKVTSAGETGKELYFDLAIVLTCAVLVEDLSANLEEATNPFLPIFRFLFKLIPTLNIWSNINLYYNRFGQPESIPDTVLAVLQFMIIGFLCMGFQVAMTRYDGAENRDISDSLLRVLRLSDALQACSHFIFIVVYLRVALLVKTAKPFCIPYVVYHTIMSVLWAIAAAVPDYWFTFAWVVMLNIFECEKFYIWINIGSIVKMFYPEFKFVPLNVPLMQERTGLIIIIAMGETITTVASLDLKPDSIATTLMICAQAFLFKFAFFDVFDAIGERARRHGLKVSRFCGIMTLRLTIFTLAGILGTTMYLYNASAPVSDRDVEHKRSRQVVYAICYILVLLSSYFMGLCHEQYPHLLEMQIVPVWVRTAFMLIASVIMFIVAAAVKYDNRLKLISIECSIVAVCLAVEFFSKWFLLRQPTLKQQKTIEDPVSGTELQKMEKKNEDAEQGVAEASSQYQQERMFNSFAFQLPTAAMLAAGETKLPDGDDAMAQRVGMRMMVEAATAGEDAPHVESLSTIVDRPSMISA